MSIFLDGLGRRGYKGGTATEDDMGIGYDWGKKAFEAGSPFEACPYPRGSAKATEWRLAWMDAKADETNKFRILKIRG